MARLKDRNRLIPNGFRFYQPETRWEGPRHTSFNALVDSIIAHRKANPSLMAQHGWSADPSSVSEELDAYNTKLCQQFGWHDYIMEGGQAPAATPFIPLPNRLKSVAAGARDLVHWINDGAEAVPFEKALARAQICKDCPQNGRGDFTSYFTVPVSEAIRAELNRRREMKLSTPIDEYLGVCLACACPLKLKIHIPIENIRTQLQPEAVARLDERCWIPKEAP